MRCSLIFTREIVRGNVEREIVFFMGYFSYFKHFSHFKYLKQWKWKFARNSCNCFASFCELYMFCMFCMFYLCFMWQKFLLCEFFSLCFVYWFNEFPAEKIVIKKIFCRTCFEIKIWECIQFITRKFSWIWLGKLDSN